MWVGETVFKLADEYGPGNPASPTANLWSEKGDLNLWDARNFQRIFVCGAACEAAGAALLNLTGDRYFLRERQRLVVATYTVTQAD